MTIPPFGQRERLDFVIHRHDVSQARACFEVITACCDGFAHITRDSGGTWLRAGLAPWDWRNKR
jgi:hypothetical protein